MIWFGIFFFRLTSAKVSTRKMRLPLELWSWEMCLESNRIGWKDELVPKWPKRLHAAYAAAAIRWTMKCLPVYFWLGRSNGRRKRKLIAWARIRIWLKIIPHNNYLQISIEVKFEREGRKEYDLLALLFLGTSEVLHFSN